MNCHNIIDHNEFELPAGIQLKLNILVMPFFYFVRKQVDRLSVFKFGYDYAKCSITSFFHISSRCFCACTFFRLCPIFVSN